MPKWQARARRGQYLGISPDHSSTIGRILNLRSGFISPQYHVIYDDLFSTVPNAESGGTLEPSLDGSFWRKLIATGYESLLPADEDDPLPELHPDWLTDAELRARQRDHTPARLHPSPPLPVPLPFPSVPPSVAGGTNDQPSHQQPCHLSKSSTPEGAPHYPPLEGAPDDDDIEIVFTDDPESVDTPPPTPPKEDDPAAANPNEDNEDFFVLPDSDQYGRGKRRKKPNRHLFDEHLWTTYSRFQRGSSHPKQKVLREQLNVQFLQSLNWNTALEMISSVDHRNMENILQQSDPYDGTVEEMHPFALATKADAADNPNWEQAMNGPDSAGYWEACKKELNTLADKKHAWDVVERQPWMNILPLTWAFRCKRYPDGSVRKLKARFCTRGDKQVEGIDYFDTFAPVINWTTVRLMLILTLILNLSTCQVDYTAAFVHSPIDRDPNWENMSQQERDRSGVYLEMP